MFEELPSQIRKKFNNDPAQFLDFVQNENNKDALYEMGLALAPIPIEEEIPKQSKKLVDELQAPPAGEEE